MIDDNTIQRIYDAADIYEVVSEFVNLRKRGVNYVGCCPFHNEKTGSFTVSPAKGIYKCFGCGKGGNAVNFIMEHEQMGYVEALRYLAAKYNIPIEEQEMSDEQKREKSDRESMLVVTNFAEEFFVKQLETDEGKSVALGYMEHRGIDDESIRKFGLGYCPSQWSALYDAARAQGYKEEFLVKTGLCIKGEKGCFDRFRSRVMFPIRDIAGKTIAFGGRIMTSDKQTAKYVNSPESEIYHKSRTLYGIYFAKKSIVQQDRCFLVEGYLDVISFHRKGIENTVASSGTSLTLEQIQLIRRLTQNVTIIYDGDAAGIKASLRGIDLVLTEGLNVRVVSLPEGEDPDSFAQSHSPQEVRDYITANETDFIDFKTKLLLPQTGGDPIERAHVISDIAHSISIIPNEITRSVYVRETANRLQVEETVLYHEIARNRKETSYRNTPPPKAPAIGNMPTQGTDMPKNDCSMEETALVRYLLLYGEQPLYENTDNGQKQCVHVGEYIINELLEDDMEFQNPQYNQILHECLSKIKEPNFLPKRYFSTHHDPEISAMAASILSSPYELSKIWGEEDNELKLLGELLPKSINNYKMRYMETLSADINQQILACQKSAEDETQIIDLLKKKNAIDQIRSKLNEQLKRTGIL